MKKDELVLQRIKTEILAELAQVAQLMDEYSDFLISIRRIWIYSFCEQRHLSWQIFIWGSRKYSS